VIVFADEALGDLERIFEHHAERDPELALEHIAKVRSAIMILDAHPLIGRPARHGSTLRELVISQGKTGYIALYDYAAAERLIRVLAIRHQRELGYPER
jgi:addiction module RelE/StbE family toxin